MFPCCNLDLEIGDDVPVNHLKTLQNVLEFVEKSYSTTIKVEQLAELACMSMSTFRRHFKKNYGISPTNYIQQVRYKAVCRLLMETNLELSEVSYNCGYTDQSHMSRTFKKNTGVTPKAYRKKYR